MLAGSWGSPGRPWGAAWPPWACSGSGAASIRVGWGFGRCASRGSDACCGVGAGSWRGIGCVCGPASAGSGPLPIALRTTTGGIGREPGMLIRIRVVRVVSVLGPSESGVDGFEVTGSSSGAVGAPGPAEPAMDGYWPVPYGGVPEG